MRKSILLSVAGVLVICVAGPVQARDDNLRTARDAAQSQGAASDDPERTICVRAQLTGSRVMRRVCRTAREWIAQDGALPDER